MTIKDYCIVEGRRCVGIENSFTLTRTQNKWLDCHNLYIADNSVDTYVLNNFLEIRAPHDDRHQDHYIPRTSFSTWVNKNKIENADFMILDKFSSVRSDRYHDDGYVLFIRDTAKKSERTEGYVSFYGLRKDMLEFLLLVKDRISIEVLTKMRDRIDHGAIRNLTLNSEIVDLFIECKKNNDFEPIHLFMEIV